MSKGEHTHISGVQREFFYQNCKHVQCVMCTVYVIRSVSIRISREELRMIHSLTSGQQNTKERDSSYIQQGRYMEEGRQSKGED